MNKLIISGNLCQDIELKQTNAGKSVVQNCIAVRRDYKGPNGNYESDFINIVAWENQAKYLSSYASKGDRAEVVGRLQKRQYKAQDGSTRDVYECIVESISVIAKPKQESQKQSIEDLQKNYTFPDDLPF